jgi:hypothetical protein
MALVKVTYCACGHERVRNHPNDGPCLVCAQVAPSLGIPPCPKFHLRRSRVDLPIREVSNVDPHPVTLLTPAQERSLTALENAIRTVRYEFAKGMFKTNYEPRPVDTVRHEARPTRRWAEPVAVKPNGHTPRIETCKPGGVFPKGEWRVLTAIGQHKDGLTRVQITIVTGYVQQTRDRYVRKLAAKAYVHESSLGILTVTNDGQKALGSGFQMFPTGDALRRYWEEELPEGESTLLAIVAAEYPNAVERAKLSEVSGYVQQTRDRYLRRLIGRRKLVEKVGRGMVRAAKELFS